MKALLHVTDRVALGLACVAVASVLSLPAGTALRLAEARSGQAQRPAPGPLEVLQVYEGQSHAHYMRDGTAPETKEAFEDIARFFDRHLGK